MKYDIFLVDVDDTVLDFHSAAIAAVRSAFDDFSLDWKEEYKEEYTRFNGSLWAQLERKEITREQLHATRFPLFLQRLGIENVDGAAFNEKYEQYISTRPQYFEGAKELLTALNGAGRVYFVTNGTLRIQQSRFDVADLWKYAKDTFVSEVAGADKPAKGYTDYVLARIPDFDKKRAVWIGDSLTADVRAAVDAGIDSIWFNPQNRQGRAGLKPTYEVENFSQILKILGI